MFAAFSEIGGSGAEPVVRVWWAGCHARMKTDIWGFLPEVKASKSVRDTAILKFVTVVLVVYTLHYTLPAGLPQ